MQSIFEESAYMEIKSRLNLLNANSQGQWGKMSVGQMVWHCQIPLKLAIKNKKYNKKGNLFVKLIFKKSLYNDSPWRKNLPTAPMAKATEEKDFETEIKILNELVDAMYEQKGRTEWNPHPIFGTFTKEQWGKLEYKHLDHHLKQFGV